MLFRPPVTIVARVTTTAYDFLIVLFTFLKTVEVRRTAFNLDMNPSITVLLLRDGPWLQDFYTSDGHILTFFRLFNATGTMYFL